jgi:protease-4
LDGAAGRADLASIVVRLVDARLTGVQADEVGAAMERARTAGKRVHLFADSCRTAELMLGAHAQEIIVSPGAGVGLPGIHMEEMYLADTLGWLGVKADLVQVGGFKGANESLTRSTPSEAWDSNINSLLDSIYSHQRETIKRGRRLNDDRLDRAMESTWMAGAEEAKAARLVDQVLDWAALEDHLNAGRKTKLEWEDLPVGWETADLRTSGPLAVFGLVMRAPSHTPTGPTIAVLHVDGVIVGGESTTGGPFGAETTGARTLAESLDQIGAESRIRGVVVRINSPGGSAEASEAMWQGLKRLSGSKPVWVSVGSMAASGGYYVLAAGDRVYVNPSSIVGSIGVVGGKFSMGGLYDRLGVHVVERDRGPMASMRSTARAWSPEQLEAVRARMTRTYDLFTRRVTEGRRGIDLAQTAEGRLFTGERAVELKMADRVGGLADAVGDMAAELGLTRYDVMHYPGPKTLGDMVDDMLTGRASAPAGAEMAGLIGVLRETVGPAAWPEVRDALSGMWLLREEPVVVTMPGALIFR